MAPDFSGYATKAGLKCSDGRTIMPNAFAHQDKMQVPLVWQHGMKDPENILGHVILHNREDGVYCEGFFNDSKKGVVAKKLVGHKDIKHLSIRANELVERALQVMHGKIQEVSLVVAGANPGALIDFVQIQHSDGSLEPLDDEAVIFTGLEFEHADAEGVEHDDSQTVEELWGTFSESQQQLVHFIVEKALEKAGVKHEDGEGETSEDEEKPEGDATDEDETDEEKTEENDDQSDSDNNNEGDLGHQEGTPMGRNVFEDGKTEGAEAGYTLTHDDSRAIIAAAEKGGSLKHALEDFALEHGIDNIELLFPDAKLVTDRPEFDKRRTEWVAGVLSETKHSPFSRIKTQSADLTHDEARAKGYIKGTLKKEEFFALTERITTPTTIYKKQKLDRDDIIDITDLDVVAWIKFEMRLMLEEEIARAVLIGDGRDSEDEDKIKDGSVSGVGIRPIATEDELYAATFYVQSDATALEMVDAIISSRVLYKGTGQPTFYTKESVLTHMLLARDGVQRRLFRTVDDLAAELRVAKIVVVEVMEDEADLLGLFVNLQDYTIGADKGGETTLFDDFDIDYNQYKYLLETRLSGALTKIRSALVMRSVGASAALTVPTEPTFNSTTGVITIPTQTGVVYKNDETDATLSAGAQSALAAGASLTVRAEPSSSSYYFADNINEEWTYTRDA